jgi:UDP-glucose 4-epimerase
VTLRAFAVAGAYRGHGDADRSRILPKALAVAAGDAPYVELNGDGSAVRELTHVADLADAFALALDAARPGVHRLYHAGTGKGITMLDLLAAVERITGRRVPTVRRPPASEARSVVADPLRIQAELGWRPVRSDLDRVVADAWAAVGG